MDRDDFSNTGAASSSSMAFTTQFVEQQETPEQKQAREMAARRSAGAKKAAETRAANKAAAKKERDKAFEAGQIETHKREDLEHEAYWTQPRPEITLRPRGFYLFIQDPSEKHPDIDVFFLPSNLHNRDWPNIGTVDYNTSNLKIYGKSKAGEKYLIESYERLLEPNKFKDANSCEYFVFNFGGDGDCDIMEKDPTPDEDLYSEEFKNDMEVVRQFNSILANIKAEYGVDSNTFHHLDPNVRQKILDDARKKEIVALPNLINHFARKQITASAMKPTQHTTSDDTATTNALRKAGTARKKKESEDDAFAKRHATATEERERKQKRKVELDADSEYNKATWMRSSKASLLPLLPTFIEFTTEDYIPFSVWEQKPRQSVYIKTYPATLTDNHNGTVTIYDMGERVPNVWHHETLRIGQEPNTFYQRDDYLAPPIYVFKFDAEDQKYVDEFRQLEQKLKSAEANGNITMEIDARHEIEHHMNFLLNHLKESQ